MHALTRCRFLRLAVVLAVIGAMTTDWRRFLRPTISTRLTLAELGERYLLELERLDRPMLRHVRYWHRSTLVPDFGDLFPEDVGPRELEAWIRCRLANGAAPKTVRKELTFLSSVFTLAIDLGVANANPTYSIRRGVVPRNKPRDGLRAAAEVLERSDVARLIRSRRIAFEDRLFFGFMLLTGARSGEAAGAEWRDVDFSRKPLGRLVIARQRTKFGTIRETTKTGTVRQVPIHPELRRLLEESRRRFARVEGRAPELHDPVCWRVKAERIRRWSQHTALRRWHDSLEALGIPHPSSGPRRVHAARHTFISLLLRAEAPERWVRLMTHTGDEDRSAFRFYAHADWPALCQAILHLELPRTRA